jgi:hypothetical protein
MTTNGAVEAIQWPALRADLVAHGAFFVDASRAVCASQQRRTPEPKSANLKLENLYNGSVRARKARSVGSNRAAALVARA